MTAISLHDPPLGDSEEEVAVGAALQKVVAALGGKNLALQVERDAQSPHVELWSELLEKLRNIIGSISRQTHQINEFFRFDFVRAC